MHFFALDFEGVRPGVPTVDVQVPFSIHTVDVQVPFGACRFPPCDIAARYLFESRAIIANSINSGSVFVDNVYFLEDVQYLHFQDCGGMLLLA